MQSKTQLQHTLIYGLYTGGAIILFFLIIFMFGMVNNPRLPNVALFIFMAGVYISVKRYRDYESGGLLSFGRAYGTAVLTCLFIGILWSVYEYVLHKYLSPGLLETKIEEMQEIWLNKGFSEDLIELETAFLTPFILALSYIFSAAFWGAILSLPLAALLKREVNPLAGKQENE
jgi:hypothetical protein